MEQNRDLVSELLEAAHKKVVSGLATGGIIVHSDSENFLIRSS
jgi:predicted DNA-binding protein (UPF0251 family)